MKKVSVVVPCYNVSACLGWCVDHLIRQTIGIENIEIILVNDASTDGGATWELITQYESRYPESIIAIFLKENLRQGGARNVGVSYASGEYLMFCDADDWLRLEALEILYDLICKIDADVVEFRSKEVYEYSEIQTPPELGNGSYQLEMLSDEVRRPHIIETTDEFGLGCWTKMYRMSLIKENEIRFAEYLICEEPSFTLPVRLYASKHVFWDSVLYYYYQAPGGTVHGNWDSRKLDNANVWIILYEDLKKRGFLNKYPAEIEYMLWSWGIGLTIRMILTKGYVLRKEELTFLKEIALEYCPDIRHNYWITQEAVEWNAFLLKLLDMELTDDNIIRFNKDALQYLVKTGRGEA